MRALPTSVHVFAMALAAGGCLQGVDDFSEPLAGSAFVLEGANPGDLVEVGDITAVVPDLGLGLFSEVVYEDGTSSALALEVRLDGTVLVRDAFEPPSGEGDADGVLAAAGPCSDGAYSLASYRWTSPLRWKFNAGTTPSYLGASAVEGALRRGTANITTSRNSCDLADQVSASHVYDGREARGTGISSRGACSSSDLVNMVGFGDLPQGTLGVACTWYVPGEAVESDIKLNKVDHKWYVTKPDGCSGRFDLEGVVTHERGHSYGLGHVSEASHPSLTMSESIGACDNSARTLGLGDVRGLRQKY